MKKFLIACIGVAVIGFCLLYVNTNHKYTVVHFSEVKQDGYGIVSPETFKVDISPAMAFHYAVKYWPIGIVIGCVVLGLSFIWILIAARESINFGKANNGIYDNAGWIWLGFVLLAAIFFFASHSSIVSNNYINLSRTDYVHIRGNDATTPFASKMLDEIFLTKENIIR